MSEIDDQMVEDFAKARHDIKMTPQDWGDTPLWNSRGQIQNLLDMGYQIIPPERKVTVELTPDQVKSLTKVITMSQSSVFIADALMSSDKDNLIDAYGLLLDAITPNEDDVPARSR